MSEIDLKGLAERLWKCPFDNEVFDSSLSLWSHLCELHGRDIWQLHQVKGQVFLGDIERPEKLTFCGHCFDFVVPSAPGRHPITEIDQHIREQHPNPSGPRKLTISVSTDSKLIDLFMRQQTLREVYVCKKCTESFSDEASVADHWVKNHCEMATVEEVAYVLETDPQRLEDALTDFLEAASAERNRHQNAPPEQEDGYVIHHCPDVPRVRSKPSEHIVYIARQPVRLPDEELQELLEYEGLDSKSDETGAEDFDGSTNQQVQIDIRFCNILDGYIPLVKNVRSILPPLPEGGLIEVYCQDEPDMRFPCKVSKRKRAIYNVDRRLEAYFKKFDSGVRLYITRVGSRSYKLGVKHHQHTVRDCKFFVPDEREGWRLEVRDATVEWETGDEVFRHQFTFEQMDALHAEARKTNLSVRDAVYKVMEQLRHLERVHVRKDVYEAVFLRLRTCSLATVWAQFRPEHECYARVSPGWYRFNPSKPLPAVRYVVRPRLDEIDMIADTVARAGRTKIRVRVRWSLLGKVLNDEVFDGNNSTQTMANFLGSLVREFGPDMIERLTRVPVSRDRPLSIIPAVDFVNQGDGTVYNHKLVPGTELHLLANSSTREKHDDIKRLVAELGFPTDTVDVSIVPNPTRAEILEAI